MWTKWNGLIILFGKSTQINVFKIIHLLCVNIYHDLFCRHVSWSIVSTVIMTFCVDIYHDLLWRHLSWCTGRACNDLCIFSHSKVRTWCTLCSLSLVTKALWSEVVNLAAPSQSSWTSSVCWSLWGRQWRGARVPDIARGARGARGASGAGGAGGARVLDIARDWLSKLVLCTESSHFLFCDTFLISLLWPIVFFTPGVDGLVVVGQILVAVVVVKCRLRWKLLGENVWHIWLLSDVAWSAWNYWGNDVDTLCRSLQ